MSKQPNRSLERQALADAAQDRDQAKLANEAAKAAAETAVLAHLDATQAAREAEAALDQAKSESDRVAIIDATGRVEQAKAAVGPLRIARERAAADCDRPEAALKHAQRAVEAAARAVIRAELPRLTHAAAEARKSYEPALGALRAASRVASDGAWAVEESNSTGVREAKGEISAFRGGDGVAAERAWGLALKALEAGDVDAQVPVCIAQ